MRELGFGIGTGKMKDAHGDERWHVRVHAGEGGGGEGEDGVPVHGWQRSAET